jgi:hypothetical protein
MMFQEIFPLSYLNKLLNLHALITISLIFLILQITHNRYFRIVIELLNTLFLKSTPQKMLFKRYFKIQKIVNNIDS